MFIRFQVNLNRYRCALIFSIYFEYNLIKTIMRYANLAIFDHIEYVCGLARSFKNLMIDVYYEENSISLITGLKKC